MSVRKDTLRSEGAKRNEAWAALSCQQQLDHLDKCGLVATKQRLKIAKKMSA